jgi:CRP-like cAMP-binding protein
MNTESPLKHAPNDFYAALSPQLRCELGKIAPSIKVPAGTKLIGFGEPLSQLVIVDSGAVRSVISGGIKLLECEGGRVFGMHAILSGDVPEESAITEESCYITCIPRDTFLAFLRAHPQMYFAIARILSNDLLAAQRLLKNSLFRVSRRKSTPQLSVN